MRSTTSAFAVLVVAAGTLGMGAVSASVPPDTTTPDTATAETATAETATATNATPADSSADGAWTAVVPGGDCQCADGAEFNFFVREADPEKVVFFLEGGGACFSAESCAFTDEPSTLYDWNIGPDDHPSEMSGIFELDNPENPFADYSFVYVPYCTGDVHLGDTSREYSPEVTVEHRGWANGNAAVQYLTENFTGAEQVAVVGESAGSIASASYAGLIGDAMTDAAITVFADGSGGYPDDPNLSAGMTGLWNLTVPEYGADLAPEERSVPRMVEVTGLHNPDIVISRFDFAHDAVQVMFLTTLGLDAPLLDTIDENEARIEAAGVPQLSYTAAGDEHTLVRKDEFYEMELDGVRLVDWVAAIVAGESVDDVHCTDCGAP